MNTKKKFTSAPIPFMGQKRRFLNHFKEYLKKHPKSCTYVDLFGGSGLLSHTVKSHNPEATVIYNDFDNYSNRLANIPTTNRIIAEIRDVLTGYPKDKIISGTHRDKILDIIKSYEEIGFVDYITISSSILFAMKYAINFEQLKKETLYNCVRQSDYTADGYLDGIEVVSMDYKQLFNLYKDKNNVVFLVDPPYLSTESGTYKGYWKLKDYLDVLDVLDRSNYFYFTSNKSHIIELCEWIESKSSYSNPFAGAEIKYVNTNVNYQAKYTDIMLVKWIQNSTI